jgi:multicomponent Na+:H+ antiporter subunit E
LNQDFAEITSQVNQISIQKRLHMIGYLELLLRLTIWFLLTADLSLPNILIGLAIALIIPRTRTNLGNWREWMRAFGEVLIAIPQAYFETIEIIVRPHLGEKVTMERVLPQRTPGLIFLDIFIITFTPKTIVLKYHDQGWYEVHQITRRKSKVPKSPEFNPHDHVDALNLPSSTSQQPPPDPKSTRS